MKTEVLNEYVFAELVMTSAREIFRRRIAALEDAGEITPEQTDLMTVDEDDVREGLKTVQHNKVVVFDILAELQSEAP